jgi:MinD-like ATPase involved in chromosome partitioning or flagellar assembly
MEEDKKPGRTLQDYAHLFLSRSVDKEKQSTVSPTAAEPKEEAEKQQQPLLSNEKPGQELTGVNTQAVPGSPPQKKTSADTPVQTITANQQKRPYAVAVACPRNSIANSLLTFNLCLDFTKRGLQVMVLNADLSFASINFLAALKLSPLGAAAQQQGMQVEKPLPEIELITVDTDITLLTCPWPEEHNPIVDEITSSCHPADVILINISTGFSSNAKAFLKAADEIMLVSGFEPAHLIDTYSIIKMIYQFAPEARIGIIVLGEQTAAQSGFIKLQDASHLFLDRSLYWYGSIPWDAAVKQSIVNKAPLPPDSAGALGLYAIAEMILNNRAQWKQALNVQEPGFVEKLFIPSRQEISWEKRYQSLTRQQTP